MVAATLPFEPGAVFFGFNPTVTPFGTYGLILVPNEVPGAAKYFFTDGIGAAAVSLAIPNNPGLVGLTIFTLATFVLLAPAVGPPQSQPEDFWIARDPSKLVQTVFPTPSRVGQFQSIVLHQVQPARRDAWQDQKRQRCHFIIGNADGLGEGVVGISPKWFKGASTGGVTRPNRAPHAVGMR